MTTFILVAQLTIIASGPPLSPADAAATLRRASPELELSRGLFRLDRGGSSTIPPTSAASAGTRRITDGRDTGWTGSHGRE
jgi:hypothetical protein